MIRGQSFGTGRDLGPGSEVRGHELVDCKFARCVAGGELGSTARVSEVSLLRTSVGEYCRLEATRLEQVTVDTLSTEHTLHLENCLFDRVLLRGEIGRIHVGWRPERLAPPQQLEASRFYRDVSWALDIREARFTEAIVRGIPGDKVRLDPKRHAVLRKERVRRDPSWRSLSLALVRRLELWLALPGEEELLVASDRSPYFAQQLAHHRELRSAGFADAPDASEAGPT